MLIKRFVTKKLLVASIGVATVSYVACSNTETSGNLAAPPGSDAASDAPTDAFFGAETSGNLVAPPPPDASADAAKDGAADGAPDAPIGDATVADAPGGG
jgi:hypothetical protein